MTTKITVDFILNGLQEYVEKKIPLGPATWLDAAQKLLVLLGDEQDNLFLIQSQIAKKKMEYIEQGNSVAKAKAWGESLDEHMEARKLEAKIDRVTELIRISKLQARMSDDNLKNN